MATWTADDVRALAATPHRPTSLIDATEETILRAAGDGRQSVSLAEIPGWLGAPPEEWEAVIVALLGRSFQLQDKSKVVW